MLVTYQVRSDAGSIDARAATIAVEQSIEMPVAAVTDDFVQREIIGRVVAIRADTAELFRVQIRLSTETVGDDPGQLVNMLFGNTSLHDDVTLVDVAFPPDLAARFGGPRHGVTGLRQRVGAARRALTCTALKPQGLPAVGLARLAGAFARGGLDFVKDDHGLAEQAYAPFAARVAAITAALRDAAPASGRSTRYVPSLSGSLDAMRRQIALARAAAIDTVMIAPMIAGLANFHQLVRETPDIAFVAHPSLAGAARIAPPLLIGKLFRLLGADAVIFPNHGGRFGYSAEQCRSLAASAREPSGDLRPALPVPAGGMSRGRVPEMLDFYGPDIMLLIGGALLAAGDRLAEEAAAFCADVARHQYE